MTNSMIMRMAASTESNAAIRGALESFLAVRRETVRMAEGLTPEQASFSPAPGVWSVARNLDHLVITESLYRGQMAKMLEMALAGGKTNLDVSLGEVDLNLPFVPKALMPLMAAPLTMINYFVPAAVRETVLRYPLMKAKNPKVSEPAVDRPLTELTEMLRAGARETARDPEYVRKGCGWDAQSR